MAAMVVAPKASRLERNTMASCFSASHISTRRNSTGSSPSRFSRGKQMIWSRTTLLFCGTRSEEHTSELQSLRHLVCRLLLEKKKKYILYSQYMISSLHLYVIVTCSS